MSNHQFWKEKPTKPETKVSRVKDMIRFQPIVEKSARKLREAIYETMFLYRP